MERGLTISKNRWMRLLTFLAMALQLFFHSALVLLPSWGSEISELPT